MQIKWIWSVLSLLYLAFFSWYTSFGGPLTPEEIEHYMSRVEQRQPPFSPERIAMLRKFMEEDTGDDFVMVNIIDMHETPLQIEGVDPSMTSDQVLAKYMEYMFPALLARACHPVLYGQAASVALDQFGVEGMGRWTTGAGMRYRSRRDMLEISVNPTFSASHEFKVAAMNKTIAFPIDPWFQAGDPRFILALLFGLLGCALSWRVASRGGEAG